MSPQWGLAPGTAVPEEPLPPDDLGTRQARRFRMDAAVEVRPVVWVFVELTRGDRPPRYLAGVKFSDADPEVIEAFSARHRLE